MQLSFYNIQNSPHQKNISKTLQNTTKTNEFTKINFNELKKI